MDADGIWVHNMEYENKTVSTRIIYYILFTILYWSIIIYAFCFVRADKMDEKTYLTNFCDNWISESGDVYNIDQVVAGDFEGRVVLFKVLPEDISDGDNIFFESKNVNLKLYLDDEVIYSFNTIENLTGMGYGKAFHEVGLSREYRGRTLKLEYESVDQRLTRGCIMQAYVGKASDYLKMIMDERGLMFVTSVMIIFFGCLIFIIWFGLSDKSRLPYDLVALGSVSVLGGTWLLLGTNIFQLFTGSIYVWQIINTLLFPLLVYPFILFVNSFSKVKNEIYEHIAFYLSVLTISGMMCTRFILGFDMLMTINIFTMIMLCGTLIIVAIIYLENYFYCKKSGIKPRAKGLLLGILAFIFIFLEDAVVYFLGIKYRYPFGNFVRLLMLLFIILMLIQFIKWWSKDQEAIDRDRFINRSLKFAVASTNPVDSIKLLLEFIGKELGASRVYLFENIGKSRFVSTYGWFTEGRDPILKEFFELPYKGCIEELEKKFEAGEKCIVVEDIESIKNVYPVIYGMYDKDDTKSVVLCALEHQNKLVGLLGINNVQTENLDNVSEIVSLIAYFIVQFINQQKEQERVLYYSYHDAASGARNREALKNFTSEKLDMSQAFGFVDLRILELKEINDLRGHDAGDELIKKVAEALMEVFGADNVYRFNGGEFIAFGFEIDEVYFGNDVERAGNLMKNLDCSIEIGTAYCSNGATDLSIVMKYARERMTLI